MTRPQAARCDKSPAASFKPSSGARRFWESVNLACTSGLNCDILRHVSHTGSGRDNVGPKAQMDDFKGREEEEAWIVDYTDGEGARHIRTFARKKDADAYEDR